MEEHISKQEFNKEDKNTNDNCHYNKKSTTSNTTNSTTATATATTQQHQTTTSTYPPFSIYTLFLPPSIPLSLSLYIFQFFISYLPNIDLSITYQKRKGTTRTGIFHMQLTHSDVCPF